MTLKKSEIMKPNIYHWYDKLLSSLIAMLGFATCTGLSSVGCEYGPDPDYNTLKINPSQLQFSNQIETKNVEITTEGAWYIREAPDFVAISTMSGKGDYTISVTTKSVIKDSVSNQGVMYIEGEDETARLYIIQNYK